MTGRVVSVNVVHALIPDVRGDLDRTAIDKRPVEGRVGVRAPAPSESGVDGDQVYDRKHHGGADQAVYAYAEEDLTWWSGELGRSLDPGVFGENLTTAGLDVTGSVIGERWWVGDDGLELQITAPRIPCKTFHGWMDVPHWVKRFTERGAPGAYLRVRSPGTVGAGDPVTVVARPDHGVTVGEAFHLRQVAADRLERLLLAPDLHGTLREAVHRDLRARAR
jgi:MOSC domain-containing protein YiiM